MAGYSRQSVADIIANAVIKAAPVNAEYNAIRDAFAFSGGHKHDGSSTEGAYVPLIADTDALNKVVIDTTNNRISFYNEVSSTAVEQIRLEDGVLKPVTDDDIDLGATGAEFKDLYIDGIGYIDSVVITGGTIDGTVIGGTTPAAADFTTIDTTGNASVGGTFAVTGNSTLSGTLDVTGASTFTGAVSASNLTATGTSTLSTVDINAGNIDGTTIGASAAAAGSFTTVSTSGQATLATVDINGGAIDGAIIGATTPAAITGTTITGTSLVGPVTGDITGNVTGDVTGDLTGDVTGNVTAATGSSTFNNVTVNGTLDVTGTTIANVTDPVNAQDAATKNYVDTSVSALVDSAPGTLDTLNELAAALGDDPNFSTTITTSIATKLPLAGGTMTGAIAMGTNKITGLGDPTAAQDAATKNYADTTFLGLSGGTMTGAIDMGSSKVTTTYTPTNGADLTNKTYVDSILSSATDAATSATAAATSATNAATSATNASNSASAAATSATNAAASYDSFDDRYLGSKSTDPSTDNDGDALLTGALYWDNVNDQLKVYTGSAWSDAAFTLGSALTSVAQDTTPQLGGNLDLNNNNITGTGNISTSGTVNGRNIATDGNTLDAVATTYLPLAGGTLTDFLTLHSDPTSGLHAATKEYVDTIAAAGLHYHDPVRVEQEGNLNATYNNGTAGVGATLTNAGTQAALVIDDVTMVVGDRVLVYEQTDATQNGIYTVTDIGSASTNWVLTRATDADSYGASDPDALGQGDAFFVLEGTAGAGELYVMNTEGSIAFGTTNITFTQVAATAVYSAGTNLTLDGTTFNVSSTPSFDSLTVNGTTSLFQGATGHTLSLKSTDTTNTTGDLLGGIEFVSSDPNSPGSGTKASIKTEVSSLTGGATDLVFSNYTSSGNNIKRFDITDLGKFNFYSSDGTSKAITINASGSTTRLGINQAVPSCGLDVNTTDAIKVPAGTTAQRPAGQEGHIRLNTTTNSFEGFSDGAWAAIGGASSVGAPTLSGSSSGNEFSNTTVTITDYDSNLIYRVSVTGGSYTRAGGTITWTLPAVTTDTIHYMTVNAIDNGVTSPDAEWDIDVLNVAFTGDTGIQITDFSSNTSNTGWAV